MKAQLFSMVVLVATACLAAGPRTTPEEFFSKHLDTSIPDLSGIPACMSKGDIAEAEKIFGAYVRKTLRPDTYLKDWLALPNSPARLGYLTKKAQETMDYTLSSCGTPHHFENQKIDWESNPTYNQYVEWTYQLSRHPFWSTLAQYYLATGDERAARIYVDQITSWIDQEIVPEKAGSYETKCWRTIEAGIRVCAWAKQIHGFIKSPAVTDEFLTRFFASVWEHGWRLRKNPTRGNWLLIELNGLLEIGVAFPFLKDSPQWEAHALKRLREELDRQVYPDGFQFELSTAYHGAVPNCYNAVAALYGRVDRPVPDFVRSRLPEVYEVYIKLMQPDRRTPNINDGEWRFVPEPIRDASRLFPEREDFRWIASNGRQGSPPDYLSYAFPYSGAVTFRTSWDRDAVWGYFDASPFGTGHQHEDKLNFLMQAYGKNMVVEGGNYYYDQSETRKYVLSTRAHNTIRINGWDQNRRRTYRWNDEDIQKKADLVFETTPVRDKAVSSYTAGYGPTLDKTRHERTVVFWKRAPGLTPFFVIEDRLTAPDAKPRKWEAIWHLDTSKLILTNAMFSADFGKGIGLGAFLNDPSVKIVDMKGQKKPYMQGWMPIWAPGPHEQQPIPTPVVKGSFTNALRIVTVLFPYKDGQCPVQGVKASTDISSHDCTLVLADGTERSIEL